MRHGRKSHEWWRGLLNMVKRIGKTTIRQKSPIESEREKPRMAQEKSCCLKKKVPGITSDEAPKHCPSSSPRAGHFYHGSHSPSELGYRVYVPWNGAGSEGVAGHKWGQGIWGFQAAIVSPMILVPLRTVLSFTTERGSWPRRGWRWILHRRTSSGDEGLWQETCSQCREDRLHSVFSNWPSSEVTTAETLDICLERKELMLSVWDTSMVLMGFSLNSRVYEYRVYRV